MVSDGIALLHPAASKEDVRIVHLAALSKSCREMLLRLARAHAQQFGLVLRLNKRWADANEPALRLAWPSTGGPPGAEAQAAPPPRGAHKREGLNAVSSIASLESRWRRVALWLRNRSRAVRAAVASQPIPRGSSSERHDGGGQPGRTPGQAQVHAPSQPRTPDGPAGPAAAAGSSPEPGIGPLPHPPREQTITGGRLRSARAQLLGHPTDRASKRSNPWSAAGIIARGAGGRGRGGEGSEQGADGILESIAGAVGALREQAQVVGGAIREDLGTLDHLREGAEKGAHGAEAAAARADAHVTKGCWSLCRSMGAVFAAAGLFSVAYATIRLFPKAPGWI